MTPDALIDGAITATGLDDFGEPSFREGLDALIASLARDAALSDIGDITAEVLIGGALATRLRAVDWWNRHPEVAQEEIREPVFIVGVSRSGTTALSHLLSVDTGIRSLRSWEASSPVPPPEAATYETDERFLAAIEADENSPLHEMNPGFKAMHHDPPDMPTECVTIMSHDMSSLLYNAMFQIDGYAEWLLERDHTATYDYHRRFLQLLQSRHPGQWILKSPHHALCVDTIAEVYPDARFVWTHRDPATCIASTASISHGLASTFTDADHRMAAGTLWSGMLTEMIERLATARQRHGDRFVDVDYRALVADPVATTAQLYADLGRELTDESRARMTTHVGEHRQHRWGRHEYTFEKFGLEADALRDRLRDYCEAYDL